MWKNAKAVSSQGFVSVLNDSLAQIISQKAAKNQEMVILDESDPDKKPPATSRSSCCSPGCIVSLCAESYLNGVYDFTFSHSFEVPRCAQACSYLRDVIM